MILRHVCFFALASLALPWFAAGSAMPEDLQDCIWTCRESTKAQHEQSYVTERSDADEIVDCLSTANEMYDCLKYQCHLSEALVEDVKRTVGSGVYNCASHVTNCLAKCQHRVMARLASVPRFQPLAGVLFDGDMEQAQLRIREGCRSVPDIFQCVEDSCRIDPAIIGLVKSRFDGSDLMEMCRDEELQKEILECEMENKDRFVASCGKENLDAYERAIDRMPALLATVDEVPSRILNTHIRKAFNHMCRKTTAIMECALKTYGDYCPLRVSRYVVNALAQVMDVVSPDEIGLLGDECMIMAETIDLMRNGIGP